MKETTFIENNGARVESALQEAFHRDIEVHAVSLLRDSVLQCPEMVASLDNAKFWRKEVFYQTNRLDVLQTVIVGCVGRSKVAQIVPKIRDTFNQTIELLVSRIDSVDLANNESAAEIARIAVNSKSKGSRFLSEIEDIGRKFNEDLADIG